MASGGGVDVRTTSSTLGHAHASTTLRIYARVVSERQRATVDVIGDVLRSPENALARHLGRQPESDRKNARKLERFMVAPTGIELLVLRRRTSRNATKRGANQHELEIAVSERRGASQLIEGR